MLTVALTDEEVEVLRRLLRRSQNGNIYVPQRLIATARGLADRFELEAVK